MLGCCHFCKQGPRWGRRTGRAWSMPRRRRSTARASRPASRSCCASRGLRSGWASLSRRTGGSEARLRARGAPGPKLAQLLAAALQDPPSAPPRPAQAGARGAGAAAQPGHPGQARTRCLTRAGRRGRRALARALRLRARAFRGGAPRRGSAPRHQVAELPPIAVRVTEHRLQRGALPGCGARTRAELPAERSRQRLRPAPRGGRRHPRGQKPRLPPRHGRARRRAVRLPARDRHDRRDRAARRAWRWQSPRRGFDHVRFAPAVNVDETGWRLRGGKRTLWGALTERAALFRIAPDRHEREARALLGEGFGASPARIAGGPTTTSTPSAARSAGRTCIRDFTAQSEGLDPEKSFGEAGLEIAGRLFQAWDDFRRDGDRAGCSSGWPRSSAS